MQLDSRTCRVCFYIGIYSTLVSYENDFHCVTTRTHSYSCVYFYAGPPPTRSFPPPGPTPPGGMPNASHLVPTRVWSEFQTPEGKPYFYNKITRGSVWEKPTDFDLVMPLPPEIGAPPSGPPHQRMPLPHPAPSPGPRLPLIATPPMFRPPGRPPFNPGFPPGPPGHPAAAVMNQGLSPHIMEPRFPPPHTHLFSTPPPAGAVWPAGVEGGTAREPEEMEVENNSSAPSVSCAASFES